MTTTTNCIDASQRPYHTHSSLQQVLFSALVLLIISLSSVDAQNESKQWLRYPAISPDGSQIAFCAKGDIYTVAVNGGKATKLTSHAAYENQPVWSPDGNQIAFASNRNGNYDVFVIPSKGGSPTRLTFNSRNDRPTDFTIDGQRVLFNSTRTDAQNSLLHYSLGELYSVSVMPDRPTQLLSIPAWEAKINATGDLLFEEVKGYEDEFRKHHTSSVTRDIWLKKKDGGFQKLSTFEGENRNAVFGNANDVYYLSEASGSFNVHHLSLSDSTSKQLSSFENHPVRYLSIADSGLLCYSYNGSIYTQQTDGQATELAIDIAADVTLPDSKLLFVSGDVSEMVLSPNGKELAFIFRGDVFVTTVKGQFTRQLTFTPEQERSIDFGKEGKTLVYAGERNNSWNLYLHKIVDKDAKYFVNALELKESVLLVNGSETFQPKFSPDGKKVAYIHERTSLKVIDVKSKAVITIHNGEQQFSYADGDQYFAWSPDSKWFLIPFLPNQYWFDEIGLIKADGTGEVRNLTSSGYYDYYPKWSKSGDMMYWQSNKNGMKSMANTGSFSVDIYGLFFSQTAFDTFKLSKAEAALVDKEEDDEDEASETDAKKKKKGKSKDDEKSDKDKVKAITFDFDGIENRKVKLSLFSSYIDDMVITPDKKHLVYMGLVDNEYHLWKTNIKSKKTTSLGDFGRDGGSIQMDKDGENIFVLSDGSISKISIADGESEGVSINGEMTTDLVAERMHLFEHVTRQVEKKFLDPNLHGTDWKMYSENYGQFIPSINNDQDFSDILSELLGELNASHTGASYYGGSSKGDRTASFGAYYDTNYTGNGLKINAIMAGSPLIQGDKKIKTGCIIEAVDGKPILANTNYYPLLNRKAGKMIIVSFYNPNTNKRWKERIKPISLRAEQELVYKQWVKRNRALVHQLSNGQIGYMHIRGMSDRHYRQFLDEVMGEEHDKKALIVDTRFNGGGDLVDDINTFLSGEQYMTFETADRVIGFESQRRWTKPSIMLVGESNYSDAHCTPVGYQDLKIGKIVGMPVPGTCSFVWWEQIQNGVVFGIPNLQVKDKAGDVLENKELKPDFEVKNDFDKIVEGEDQQIAKAVEELLKEVD